jgi:hypothetical protein
MTLIFKLFTKGDLLLESLFQPSTRTIFLSFFRVFLAFHICKKLFFTWPYLGVLYANGSFAKWTDSYLFGVIDVGWVQSHYAGLNIVLLGAALCMGVGLGRRLSVATVFVLEEILHRADGFVLDGGDNFLEFLLLYLCFCNSFDYLSVSRKFNKTERYQRIENLFTNLGVGSIIFHLLVIYFVAGITKANAEVWFNGTALYYILLNERFCGTSFNPWLVQHSLFVTMGTYGSMFWEISFPFLVFNKRFRIPVIIYGMLMHIGIYVLMMINEFEMIFMVMYGFFFTNEEILKGLGKIKSLTVDRWRPLAPTLRQTD